LLGRRAGGFLFLFLFRMGKKTGEAGVKNQGGGA